MSEIRIERRKNITEQPKVPIDYVTFIQRHSLRMKFHYFMILASVEFILGFSWIGFLNFQPVSITTLHIPVLIAAVFFGRWLGAAMGGVFGLISMWRATYLSFTPIDAVFSPFTSGDPVGSLVVSLGARIIFGFVAGCIFDVIKKFRPEIVFLSIGAFVATYIHSALVTGMLQCFFPQMGVTLYTSIEILGNLNGFISCGLAMVIVSPLYMVVNHTDVGQRFASALAQTGYALYFGKKVRRLALFFIALLVLIVSLVMHLIGRIQRLLSVSNYNLDNLFSQMVFDVGMQFAAGVMAVSFLLFLVFIYFYYRSAEAANMAEQDSLTKVLNRGTALQRINRLIQNQKFGGKGIFIMIDIDHFKEINDSCGHPYGDKVLQNVATILQQSVRTSDIVGRLGGDEFCVYMPGDMSKTIFVQRIQELFNAKERIHLPAERGFSWSFGIAFSSADHTFDDLYREADDALYVSKHSGRNCYHYYSRE